MLIIIEIEFDPLLGADVLDVVEVAAEPKVVVVAKADTVLVVVTGVTTVVVVVAVTGNTEVVEIAVDEVDPLLRL